MCSFPLPSTFRLFTIFTRRSRLKPIAFLISTIIFSILSGVLLGLFCGLQDLNLRPVIPSSLNLFTTHCNWRLLLLIIFAASCLVILIKSIASILTTILYRLLTISGSFFNSLIIRFSKYTSPFTIIIDFHFFVYCE